MSAPVPIDLLAAARDAADKAYAPYSRFAVGAAAQTKNGRIYTSANMENISYGLTICAEVGALQQASSAGALSDIIRVAVVGGPMDVSEGSNPQIVTPCGRCRQLIMESAQVGNFDVEVWCASRKLEELKCYKISELLPHSFGPLKDWPPTAS
jgi:cytidine deaminase